MKTHARTAWRCTSFVVPLVASAGLFAFGAQAADLGGNCCQDLEERVAELEATTARKGNRKITVTVYGQVNKAMLWHDGFADNVKGVVDGAQSPTMFGLTGVGKITPDWSAGYRIEIGVADHPLEVLAPGTGLFNELVVRHSFLWLEHKTLGKISLGKTSMASDGIGEISTANTVVASRMLSLEPLSSSVLLGIDLPYDGPRRNLIRYDSASVAGFMLSASWSSGSGVGLNNVFGAADDAWDIALRYAGEFSGIRLAAGLGYRKENYVLPIGLLPVSHDAVITGSASVMHMASGLFVNAGAGWAKDANGVGCSGPVCALGPDHNTYHGQAGIEKNFFGFGATTVFGEYARFDLEGMSANPNMMGLGVVQKIDAAAMDLYLSAKRYDMDDGSDKLNVFMLGARIQF